MQQAKQLSDTYATTKDLTKLMRFGGLSRGCVFINPRRRTADMVCVYDGMSVIGDCKQVLVKKKEWIEDYFVAIKAYVSTQ